MSAGRGVRRGDSRLMADKDMPGRVYLYGKVRDGGRKGEAFRGLADGEGRPYIQTGE